MLVSLMGSSILSEDSQHLDSQDGALQRYHYSLNRLPAYRLLLPRSGLSRSDLVLWPRAAVPEGPLSRRCWGQSGPHLKKNEPDHSRRRLGSGGSTVTRFQGVSRLSN